MVDKANRKPATQAKGVAQKGVPCPQRGKPLDRIRTKSNRAVRLYSVLWANPTSWVLDKRTNMSKSLCQVRDGLIGLFPAPGPDRAAMLLIDRLTFKSLKLALYELNDLTLVAEEAFTPRQETPGTAGGGNENSGANFQKYIQMSNSFREDLRLLYNMSKAQSPTQTDPDLKEYLEALRKAAKAQIVNVERE